MKIFNMLSDAIRYVSEGVTRIFEPNDDQYPETGVQPFEGDPYSKWVDNESRR